MKIAVLGNCQAAMVYACLQFLTDAELHYRSPEALVRLFEEGGEAALKALLELFDLVIAQSFDSGPGATIGDARIKAASRRWVGFPALSFIALHPDQIGVETLAGEGIQSPLGGYHSALTVAGYRLGFSVDETLSLFRREVLDRLGYLYVWDHSQRGFEAHCAALGFPGRQALASWTRRGVFLHTTNHPKLFVMEDIARITLKLAGVPCRAESCCDYLHDGLMQQVWPVYPDIAASYSLPGSYVFRRESNPRPPLDRYPAQMGLETFVRGSYELYKPHGRDNMRAPMPDRWLADAAITSALRPDTSRPDG